MQKFQQKEISIGAIPMLIKSYHSEYAAFRQYNLRLNHHGLFLLISKRGLTSTQSVSYTDNLTERITDNLRQRGYCYGDGWLHAFTNRPPRRLHPHHPSPHPLALD